MARRIFYSFHYDNDVFRVQQIRNIGALEGNQPASINEWEQIKRGGDRAIRKWIDANMHYRSCVVVLIGTKTAYRPWVKYEIEKAWNDNRGLLGIYIHNISCLRNGKCVQGPNPFDRVKLTDGRKLSELVPCYNPKSSDAYNDIKSNLEGWIENAIMSRG